MRHALYFCLLVTTVSFAQSTAIQSPIRGYYREPVAHGDTLVFAAEGDLWTVPIGGGVAHRLTTHPAEETHPVISPDGQTLAFTARYEGPTELYTMPLAGGLPTRRTFEGEAAIATAFTPQGSLVYTTQYYSTLPDPQLVSLDLRTGVRTRIPLNQATEASYDSSGKTLYFVRPAFHNNVNALVSRRHRAADLEISRRRAGSRKADARLRRREPHADVVGQSRLLHQRPRRHDERVVDERIGR